MSFLQKKLGEIGGEKNEKLMAESEINEISEEFNIGKYESNAVNHVIPNLKSLMNHLEEMPIL